MSTRAERRLSLGTRAVATTSQVYSGMTVAERKRMTNLICPLQLSLVSVLLTASLGLAGCNSPDPMLIDAAAGEEDVGPPSADGAPDVPSDAAADAGVDASADALVDAGFDASDSGIDPDLPLEVADVFRFGGDFFDAFTTVIVDEDGNVYASGGTQSRSDIVVGEDTLVLPPNAARGHLIVSLTSEGVVRWGRWLPGGGTLTGPSPTTPLAFVGGELVVGGVFDGTDVDFGNGVEYTADSRMSFLVTLDRATGVTEATRVIGSADATCNVQNLLPRADGGLIVQGQFSGELDLGGGAFEPGARGGTFLAAYRADATYEWSHEFTASLLGDAATMSNGDVVFVGAARDDTNLGDGTAGVPDGSSAWPFASRFADDGSHVWAEVWEVPGRGSAVAVAPAEGGGALILIDVDDTFEIQGTSFVAPESVIAAFDSEGSLRWGTTLSTDIMLAVANGLPGEVIALGHLNETWELPGLESVPSLDNDAALVRMNASDGALRSAQLFGGSGVEMSYAFAPDGEGGYWIGGLIAESEDFVPGSFGENDALLFHVVPEE